MPTTISLERLNALARFAPEFEHTNFSPGEWTDPVKGEDGTISMPFAQMSEQAMAFVQAAYDNGWVVGHFDWPSWAGTEAAQRLRDDQAALARATPDELARLLTVVIRQDRFCEGALLEAFTSGLILRIVRRIDVLLKEAQSR